MKCRPLDNLHTLNREENASLLHPFNNLNKDLYKTMEGKKNKLGTQCFVSTSDPDDDVQKDPFLSDSLSFMYIHDIVAAMQ